MHEFSLAQGLMQQLSDLAEKHNAAKIITVKLAIGRLSGIVIDSFEFGFEILAKDNVLTKEAKLIIKVIEPDLLCQTCGVTSIQSQEPQSCQACGATDTRLIGGDELILTQVEME